MTSSEKNSPESKSKNKYMFFGYGGYGGAGQPNPEIELPGSGQIKNPNIVEAILGLFGVRRKNRSEGSKEK